MLAFGGTLKQKMQPNGGIKERYIMFCMVCGNEIKNGETLCRNCGAEQNIVPNLMQQQSIYRVQQQQQYEYNSSTAVTHNGKVSFGKAITLYFKNYVNFKGRASKSEYWWVILFNMIINALLYIISYNLPILGDALSSLTTAAFLIPSISLSIRRLHDVGKKGTYCFMGLIPIAGPVIMVIAYLKDSDGNNQWGPGPMVSVYGMNGLGNNDVQSQRIVTDNDICAMVYNHEPVNLYTPAAKNMMDSALRKILPSYTGTENIVEVLMYYDPQSIKQSIAITDIDSLMIILKALDFYIKQGNDPNVLGLVQQNVFIALKNEIMNK